MTTTTVLEWFNDTFVLLVNSRLQTAVLTHAPRMLPSTSAVRSLRAHDSDFVAQPLAAGESGTSFAHAHVRSFLAGFRLQSTSGQGDKTTALLGFCQRRASGLRRSGFFLAKVTRGFLARGPLCGQLVFFCRTILLVYKYSTNFPEALDGKHLKRNFCPHSHSHLDH